MDLLFAIDDLYSAGWWPAEGDTCAQASDGRWYPDQDQVDRVFQQAGLRLSVSPTNSGRLSRARLFQGPSVRCTVLASDPHAASVLALAEATRHRAGTGSPARS